jgi:hypothetical protein
MSFSVSWNNSSSFSASFFDIATSSFVLSRERLAGGMFPNYGGTKAPIAAFLRDTNAGRLLWIGMTSTQPSHGALFWQAALPPLPSH